MSKTKTNEANHGEKKRLEQFQGYWGVWWSTQQGEARFKQLSKDKEQAERIVAEYEAKQKEREKNKQNNARKGKDGQTPKQEKNNKNSPKLEQNIHTLIDPNAEYVPPFNKNAQPPDDEADELKKMEEKKLQKEWEKLWNSLTPKQKGKANKLMNAEAVQLKAGEKVLNVIFTQYTVGKTLSLNPNKYILHWKRENVDKFPDILKCLKFDNDKAEEGKGVGIHSITKRWYYFVGEYSDGKDTFIVNADIADTGEQQILYLLRVTKKELS